MVTEGLVFGHQNKWQRHPDGPSKTSGYRKNTTLG